MTTITITHDIMITAITAPTTAGIGNELEDVVEEEEVAATAELSDITSNENCTLHIYSS